MAQQDKGYLKWLAQRVSPKSETGKQAQAAARAFLSSGNGNGHTGGNGHVPGNGRAKQTVQAQATVPNGAKPKPEPQPNSEPDGAVVEEQRATPQMPTSLTPEVGKALRAPFDPRAIGWKAQSTSKDKRRALAVAYVDARVVAARLDRVVGPAGWHDSFTVLRDETREVLVTMTDGKQQKRRVREVEVECALTILGVAKTDVGMGEDMKSAYSDAFKRAAVKFGVARYIYGLPKVWVDYDPAHKRLLETPQLPAWANPKPKK